MPHNCFVSMSDFLHSFKKVMYVFYASICSGIPWTGLDVLKESDLARFLRSSLMKLVPMSDRNFSV